MTASSPREPVTLAAQAHIGESSIGKIETARPFRSRRTQRKGAKMQKGCTRHRALGCGASRSRSASCQPAGVVKERMPERGRRPMGVRCPVVGSIHAQSTTASAAAGAAVAMRSILTSTVVLWLR